MGARIARYTFVPKENEQIETVVTLEEEPRSMIHGVVKDWKGRYVKDAVVKIFKVKNVGDMCDLIPITHTFTDDCGQFMFGPLSPNKKYVIKVWSMAIKHCKPKEDDCRDHYVQVEDYETCEKDVVITKHNPESYQS